MPRQVLSLHTLNTLKLARTNLSESQADQLYQPYFFAKALLHKDVLEATL